MERYLQLCLSRLVVNDTFRVSQDFRIICSADFTAVIFSCRFMYVAVISIICVIQSINYSDLRVYDAPPPQWGLGTVIQQNLPTQ